MEKEKFQKESILKAYDNAQNMIALADSKANLSITLQSLLITIGLGSSLLANLFSKIWQFNKIWFWIYSTIVIVFVLTSMTGVVFSILVYIARFPNDKEERKRKGMLYHEQISKYEEATDYYKKVKKNTNDVMLEDFAIQTFCVATIATEKMKFVNYSIWFLLVNIFLTVVLLVFSGFLLVLL